MEIDIKQVLLQLLNFGILVFIFGKFMFQPILKILDARSKKIQDGQLAAEKSLKEAAGAEKKQAERLAEASKKAAGMKFTINLVTPDNGENFVIEMSNSALTNIKGQQAKNPNLTITLNRSDLERVMGGQTTFETLLAEGKAKFDGDRKAFDQLKSTLTIFKPDFELIPGTKAKKQDSNSAPKAKDPFAAQDMAITAGE